MPAPCRNGEVKGLLPRQHFMVVRRWTSRCGHTVRNERQWNRDCRLEPQGSPWPSSARTRDKLGLHRCL